MAMTPVLLPVLSLVKTVGAIVGLAVLLGVGSAEGKTVGSADGGVVGTMDGCGLPPKNVGFRVIEGSADGAGTAASSALARVGTTARKWVRSKASNWVVVRVEWLASSRVGRLVLATVRAPGLESAAASARSSVRLLVTT